MHLGEHPGHKGREGEVLGKGGGLKGAGLVEGGGSDVPGGKGLLHIIRCSRSGPVCWIVQLYRCAGVQVCRCSGVQVFRCGGVHVLMC